MATILASDLEARITTVLQNYLPAELDLIDIQRGGAATPDISTYYSGPRPVTPIFPNIVVDVKRWEWLAPWVVSMSTGRMDYHAHAELQVNLQTTGEDTNRMRDLAERIMAGIIRVLCIRKDGLETALDNTRMGGSCLGVKGDGDVTVIDEEQGSGAMIRSVRIPIAIWMSEGF